MPPSDIGNAATSVVECGRKNRASRSPIISHPFGRESVSGLVGVCTQAVSPTPPHQSLTVDLGFSLSNFRRSRFHCFSVLFLFLLGLIGLRLLADDVNEI